MPEAMACSTGDTPWLGGFYAGDLWYTMCCYGF
jgi:hypothetical protein